MHLSSLFQAKLQRIPHPLPGQAVCLSETLAASSGNFFLRTESPASMPVDIIVILKNQCQTHNQGQFLFIP
jgi:hypothetical protein